MYDKIDLTQKIIDFSQQNNNLILKYSPSSIVKMIDAYRLIDLQKFINKDKYLTIQNLVVYMISNYDHPPEDTLFFVMGLNEFYQEIKQKYNLNRMQPVKINNLTDYLYDFISVNDFQTSLPLNQSPDFSDFLFKIVQNKRPMMHLQASPLLPLVSKNSQKKDKILKKPLSKLIIAQNMKRILVLGVLASTIQIYDQQLKLRFVIKPKISQKYKKQLPILSIAYSNNFDRIGCVIKNVGLVFWESSDCFQTEKVIWGVNAQSIIFLSSLNCWFTHLNNKLDVWDLQQERSVATLQLDTVDTIGNIIDIPNAKIFIIVLNLKNGRKMLHCYSFENYKFSLVCKLDLLNNTCHSICYNKTTNSLITLGFKNSVEVWQLDLFNCQINHSKTLLGHQSIISSVVSITTTSVIITGDENGEIRLWDLATKRCIQSLKISQQIKSLDYFNGNLIFCDKRINIIKMDMPKNQGFVKNNLTHFYDKRYEQLYIINQKECSVIQMKNGLKTQVNVLCVEDQQIMVAKMFQNYLYFGTNKGNMHRIDSAFKIKKSFKTQNVDILHMIQDSNSLCFLVVGSDGKICTWIQNSDISQKPQKLCQSLNADEWITGFQLLQALSLLIVSTQNTIRLIDFQSMKIDKIIYIQFPIRKIVILPNHPIILIISEELTLYGIEINKKETSFIINNKIQINLLNTVQQGQKFNAILVSENNNIVVGSNMGRLIKFDLSDYLKDNDLKQLTKTFINQSTHIFRQVSQKNKQILQQGSQYQQSRYISINLSQFKHIQIKPILNIYLANSILQLKSLHSPQFISVLLHNGIIQFLDSNTFQIISEKHTSYLYPFKWSLMPQSHSNTKKSILQALQILQSINKTQFSEIQQNFINIQNLQIDWFLSSLLRQQNTANKQNKNQQKQILFKTTHKRRSATCDNILLSLKTMENQKKIKKNKQSITQIYQNRPKKRRGLSDDASYAQFLKPDYREQTKLKNYREQQGCQLYRKIQCKFKKYQQQKNKALRVLSQNLAQHKNTKFRLMRSISKQKSEFECKSTKSIQLKSINHSTSTHDIKVRKNYPTNKIKLSNQNKHKHFINQFDKNRKVIKKTLCRNLWNYKKSTLI